MIGQQIRELRELCMLKIKTVNIEYKYHYRLTIKSEKTRRRSLQLRSASDRDFFIAKSSTT